MGGDRGTTGAGRLRGGVGDEGPGSGPTLLTRGVQRRGRRRGDVWGDPVWDAHTEDVDDPDEGQCGERGRGRAG